jgi:hypothetical protein
MQDRRRGKGKIGEPVMPGQGLADEAERTRVEGRGTFGTAGDPGTGDAMVQQPRLAESGNELAASRIDLCALVRVPGVAQLRAGECRSGGRNLLMHRFEPGQGEAIFAQHVSLPGTAAAASRQRPRRRA